MEKMDSDHQSAEDLDKMREQDKAKKEQDFDDFLAGKAPKKEALITDDMNL